MLLVIFGAGASYDSVYSQPSPSKILGPLREGYTTGPEDARPPLACQLFDTRPIFTNSMHAFPDFMTLITPLRKPGISVERELARFQDQAKAYPPAYRELAAIRYYLHFALSECQASWHQFHHGNTNFVTLLREIDRWRFESNQQVCFVTFNYDTMLEDAMKLVLALQPLEMDSYVTWRNYSVIKLHGSANWGRLVDGIDPSQGDFNQRRLISMAAGLRITDIYQITRGRPMLMSDDGHLIFPALSIPVENKDQFSCPSSHVEKLDEVLPQVTKIITIGWRATEEDFLKKLWSKVIAGRPLMIVSGDDEGAKETYRNLRPNYFPGPHIIKSGFSGLMNQLDSLEGFLRRQVVL